MLKITKRGTNAKRHTTHYLVGKKWMTRKDTVELARRGKIQNVVVCRGERGSYIQSLPGTVKLYDLPVRVS